MLKYHDLHKKLLYLAVIPILITCTLLATAFGLLHINEIEQQQQNNKRLIEAFFGNSSISSQHFIEKITLNANALLNVEEFHSVTLLNQETEIIRNFGLPTIFDIGKFTPSQSHYWCEKKHCFYHYVLEEKVTPSYSVVVTMSRLQNSLANYKALLIILIAAILCILVTSYYAEKLKTALINPIESIRIGLRSYLDGKYNHAIEMEKGEVYSSLVDDINLLADQQKILKDNLQNNIEHSTVELRETLETVEIQNIELDLARKSALQASRVKSEFLANISHEIRTPLNGIIGFAELLKKTDLSSQQGEYLETIDESAKGLLTIINDILDFSRLEIGKLTLEYKPVRIRQVIEDSIKLHAPSAHQKKLRLLTVIDHDIPEHLLGDPLRLKQVLNNLISNAIKFTNSGHILVSLSKEDRENSQLILKFRITDSGIGLTQEQQESLFDAFTQLDSSESRAYGGTGLGLAIAKGLVDRMNGRIGVESEQGKGATFWFTSILGRNPKAAQSQGYLTGTLNKTRILVYDCNTLGRNEITHYLRGWGAEIVEAAEFDSIIPTAEKATEKNTVQLAILDAQFNHKTFDKNKLLKIINLLNKSYSIPAIILAPPNIERQVEPLIKSTPNTSLHRPIFCNRLHQQICEQLGIIIPESSSEPVSNQAPVVQNTIRILAVDDNPANLRLVTELLKELKIESVGASSGSAALDELEKSQFDLVLMDIQMPGMDGLETTKILRQKETKNHRTPVVALTAHAVNEQKAKLLLAGMDDYLTKPVGENELRHVIERWVGRHETYPTPKEQIQASAAAAHLANEENLTPLVDLQLSLSLTNNKADLAMDMLAMLLKPLPETLQQIEKYTNTGNIKDLQEVVHKLHGGACYCGVPSLKLTSEKLDKTLQAALGGGPTPSNLEQELQPLVEVIRQLTEWEKATNLHVFFGLNKG